MSERLIKHWGKNAEVTFGATGAKGDLGEQFAAEFFRSRGYIVNLHDDREKQISGFDITFQKPTDEILYGADVKNNMNDDGTFFVECEPSGWLLNPVKKSKLIIHVNPTWKWVAWYARSRMIRFVRENNHEGKTIIPIGRFTKGVEWIERKRAD